MGYYDGESDIKLEDEYRKCIERLLPVAAGSKFCPCIYNIYFRRKLIMKRSLAIFVAAALAMVALTACSSSAESTTVTDTSGAEMTSSAAEMETEATSEAAAELSGSVSTDGSTSMEQVIGILGESFTLENPGVTFTYNPTGSGSGITAVQEGRCDIGLSSRALHDDEAEAGLIGETLCLDGIAVIVNPENPVNDLSLEQIAQIYTGEITNWSEVGGNDEEIVLIGREAGSGTRDGFESITGTEDLCRYRQELTSTGDVITTVSQNPAAVGYASLSAVSDSVKALTVDGIEASEETVRDGSYQIQRPFVLVTMEGTELSKQAQAFYDYAMSSEVADLIAQAGAVAIH